MGSDVEAAGIVPTGPLNPDPPKKEKKEDVWKYHPWNSAAIVDNATNVP